MAFPNDGSRGRQNRNRSLKRGQPPCIAGTFARAGSLIDRMAFPRIDLDRKRRSEFKETCTYGRLLSALPWAHWRKALPLKVGFSFESCSVHVQCMQTPLVTLLTCNPRGAWRLSALHPQLVTGRESDCAENPEQEPPSRDRSTRHISLDPTKAYSVVLSRAAARRLPDSVPQPLSVKSAALHAAWRSFPGGAVCRG